MGIEKQLSSPASTTQNGMAKKSNILQGHNRLELIAKVTQDSDAKDNF